MTRRFTLCHTSDWHLGHTLRGHSRAYEHARFLEFLLDVVERESVDALIVAGDVFDTANPPASAQSQFYRFLSELRARCPGVDVLVVAGNHDSATRLGAADPVLQHIGVRVVGPVPRVGGVAEGAAGGAAGGEAEGLGAVDPGALALPLRDAAGEVAAWVAAVPFLRHRDLPAPSEAAEDPPTLDAAPPGAPEGASLSGAPLMAGSSAGSSAGSAAGSSVRADPFVAGARAIYGEALAEIRRRREAGVATLATGHCHMVDTTPSELSERRLRHGFEGGLPVDLFGDDVDYVALGHLHLAQAVGAHEHVRYCGSPIPLSMPEETYAHQVRLVRFEDGRLVSQSEVRVPRTVDLLRLGVPEALAFDEVLAAIDRLELSAARPHAEQPLLEVRIRLAEPMPDLRERIADALDGRPVRLVNIGVEFEQEPTALADSLPQRELSDLTPEQVFLHAYGRRYDDGPSEALLRAFREVVEAARAGGDEGAGA